MTAWASIELFLSDDFESAATIARRASVSLSRAIIGLTYAVNMRLIEWKDAGLRPRPFPSGKEKDHFRKSGGTC